MEKGSQQPYVMTRECFCAVTLWVPVLLSDWTGFFYFLFFFIAVNLSGEKKREFSWDTFFSFPALNNPIIFGFMLVFASIAIVRFLSQSDFSILMVRKKNMFHYDWL